MAKKNLKGKFITFEGSEGSGKSTHSRLVYNYLKKKGYEVVYIREPGGTNISEKIRSILLDSRNTDISEIAEMLLYMAARYQLVKEVIRPALAKGKIVICDRFLDATFAYQGYGLGIDLGVIRYIGTFVTEGIRPNLTLFLDIPTKLGLRRAGRVKDRIERRSLAFHRRVRKGYLTLAKRNHERVKVIKVKDQDKYRIQLEIRNLVLKYVT